MIDRDTIKVGDKIYYVSGNVFSGPHIQSFIIESFPDPEKYLIVDSVADFVNGAEEKYNRDDFLIIQSDGIEYAFDISTYNIKWFTDPDIVKTKLDQLTRLKEE